MVRFDHNKWQFRSTISLGSDQHFPADRQAQTAVHNVHNSPASGSLGGQARAHGNNDASTPQAKGSALDEVSQGAGHCGNVVKPSDGTTKRGENLAGMRDVPRRLEVRLGGALEEGEELHQLRVQLEQLLEDGQADAIDCRQLLHALTGPSLCAARKRRQIA